MTLNASGFLGIGQTSPICYLDIYGGGGYTYARFYRSDEAGYGGRVGTGNTIYGTAAARSLGLDGYSSISFGIAGTEVGRFDSSGNLGLGVTPSAWNSAYRLMQFSDVTGAFVGGSGYALQAGANAYINSGSSWIYGGGAYGASRYTQFNGAHIWYNAPSGTAGSAITFTQAMTLDTSGNLLVGTTSASGKFVSNTTTAIAYSGYFVNNYTGDGVYSYANANNTTYKSLTCSGSSGINFYVYSNGTYGTVSDRRLKKNIETTRDGYIDDVMKLRVVKYNWVTDEDTAPKELGWIAQELEQVFPSLVQDSQPDKKGETRKEVKTSVLPFILLKAIQEQQVLITQLTTRLTTLENK